ncbi:MAG: hypothetical protein Q9184_004357 [Pyrenodesmia sp. 2 TL-2023]
MGAEEAHLAYTTPASARMPFNLSSGVNLTGIMTQEGTVDSFKYAWSTAGAVYNRGLLTRKQHQVLNVNKISIHKYDDKKDTAADVVAAEEELDKEAQLPRVL